MTSYNEETGILRYDVANAVPHCPVMLVLDTSHSMWGQGLADMKASLKTFYQTITNVQFLNAQVDISATSMGDNLCILEEFKALKDSDLPNRNIRPKGDTPIGAALEMALNALREQIRHYEAKGISYVTPQLILLSDGKSTDDFQAVAGRIRELTGMGRLICNAIALGNDADMAALAQIAGKQGVKIPNHKGMRQSFAEVGEMVSKTYEEEAPEVMMGNASPHVQYTGTEYLLDGSNILHWDRYRTGITLKYLLAITAHLERTGQRFQVFFDATAPHILKNVSQAEAAQYDALLKNDPIHFQQVPAGTRADDFLLLQADSNKDALIMTQDLFRDHVDKYPWLKTENRVISGMVMNNLIFFPDISMQIPITESEKHENYDL